MKLINSVACSLKDSKNFFIPQYPSCLFPMFLNDDVIEIEKPDLICSPTSAVYEFSKLFFHSSVFFIKVPDLFK